MHYLYKIVDTLNNKIYIGQTVDPETRWAKHKSYANKDPIQYIHHAMVKYGIDKFEFEVIACCRTQEDANNAEAMLIYQYDSRNKEIGYNIKPGGNTAPHSEETRQKLREAILKQIQTQGHPALGSKRTSEQIEKMKVIQQNRTWTYTPEIRKNMSEAHKGKKQSAELVQKRVASIKAHKGDMKCNAPNCGIEDRRHSLVIDGIRYCAKHAARLKATGTLELRPRKAHNKIQFTEEQIKLILADKRAAETVGKDFDVSERVILRIRKEYKNKQTNMANTV